MSESKPVEVGSFEERLEFGNWNDVRMQMAGIPWRQLFPWQAWLKDKPWTLVWVQFLAFAFGAPFVLIHFYSQEETPLQEAAWSLSLYFSILWAAFMQRCLKPQRLGMQRIIGTWLFTSVVGVFAVVLVSQVLPRVPGFHLLAVPPESANILRKITGWVLGVGLIEEAAKLIPVVWFAKRLSQQTQAVTMAWIGVVSGLAFGATEAIVYSAHYAMGNRAHLIGYGDYLLIQFLRFVSLPLLHAVWTGIAAFFVGFSMSNVAHRKPMIAVGLGLVAVLHGLYDTFASGTGGLVIAFASLLLFVSYVRNAQSPQTGVGFDPT